MKKLIAAAAFAILAGAAFAQPQPPQGPGPVAGVEWKLGTVVTTEYKKVTGQLVLGQKLEPVLKTDGVDYLLLLPRRAAALIDAKNGDTITVEGTATTVKADVKVQPTLHAFKITANGKETDLTSLGPRGMMDRSHGPRGMMGGDNDGLGWGMNRPRTDD